MSKQPIEITERAATQIRRLMEKAPEGAQGLRLNVRPTGCSGNSYAMDYVAPGDTTAADDMFERDDVRLYIPKTHSWMLFGMTVDYIVDELGNSRFEFSNPNESGRCGCGESFYIDVDELQARQEDKDREKVS